MILPFAPILAFAQQLMPAWDKQPALYPNHTLYPLNDGGVIPVRPPFRGLAFLASGVVRHPASELTLSLPATLRRIQSPAFGVGSALYQKNATADVVLALSNGYRCAAHAISPCLPARPR